MFINYTGESVFDKLGSISTHLKRVVPLVANIISYTRGLFVGSLPCLPHEVYARTLERRRRPIVEPQPAAECEAAGMRINTFKSEALVLNQKRVACPLKDGGQILPQVEGFKYLEVLGSRLREWWSVGLTSRSVQLCGLDCYGKQLCQ